MHKRGLTHLFISLVGVITLLSLAVQPAQAQSTGPQDVSHPKGRGSVTAPVQPNALNITTYDQGWYQETGYNETYNTNYVAGYAVGSGYFRDFFVFNLSGFTGAVSASLLVYEPYDGYYSPDPSETWVMYDVTTDIAALVGGTGGSAAFDDLGSGVVYGNVTITSAADGTWIEVPLNAAGVAAINNAAGGFFAIGGGLTALSGGYDEAVFAFSGLEFAQLVVESVPVALNDGFIPLYQDDFEAGYANWTMDGLWNPESQADACGAMIAPFPSPTHAAYFGQDGICTYDVIGAATGSLTLNTPIPLPPDSAPILTFSSYEQTENVCSEWDFRYVELSTDNGVTWATLGNLCTENTWYQPLYDLSAYAGYNILLRFRFDSVDGMVDAYFGWMLDDITIGVPAPSFTTDEDTSFTTGNVLANDTDADNDPLHLESFDTAGLVGLLTSNGDGTFNYDPNGQFEWLAPGEMALQVFTYVVSDGVLNDTATVVIGITGVNDPPVPANDVYTTPEDVILDVVAPGVLGNDFDVDTPFTAVLAAPPALGDLAFNADGSFVYTPAPNFNGVVTFTYMITDGFDWGDQFFQVGFNEPEFTPYGQVDGFSTNTLSGGPIPPLRFGYQEGGVPSDYAFFSIGGPGTTLYTSPPFIEGNNIGTLYTDLGVDVNHVGFGFAESCSYDVPGAITVTAYTVDMIPVGTVVADGIVQGYSFAENWVDVDFGAPFRRLQMEFNDTCYAFVVDNLAYSTNHTLVTIDVTPMPDADLVITKTANPDPVYVGAPLTYTLAVTNVGDLAATGITLTDNLPAGVTFVSATSDQLTCLEVDGNVTCTEPINLLSNPGAETGDLSGWNVTANGGNGWATTIDTPHQGALSFVTSYWWDTRNQEIDLLAAGLSASYLDSAPAVDVGEWIRGLNCGGGCNPSDPYYIRVELRDAGHNPIASWNVGSQGTPVIATAVWTEQAHTFTGYGSGLRYIYFEDGGRDAENWAGQYGAQMDDAYATVEGFGNPFSLAPGEAVSVDILVTVNAPGDLTNTAQVTLNEADLNPLDNTVTITTTVVPPALSLAKTVVPDVDALYHETVTYTIVLANSNLSLDPAVLFSDALPPEVDFDAWIEQPVGATVVGDVITWSGMMPGQSSITFSFTALHVGNYADVVTNTAFFDGSVQDGSATAVFTVEADSPPVLEPVGNQAVDELTLLTFTAVASDENVYDVLAFSLDAGAPAGAAINPVSGVFTWTPTEAQGPGVYPVTVRVSDGILADFETIDITVKEVNLTPVLAAIGDQGGDELTLISFTAAATDADLPANTLTFSLDAGAPAGAVINPVSGVFTWTPTEAHGPGVYPVTVRVTDNGVPALDDFEAIDITVNEVNVAPIAVDDTYTVTEDTVLTIAAPGLLENDSDSDLPAQTLIAELVTPPAEGDLELSADGSFVYTPTLNFFGTVTFTYVANDGVVDSPAAQVTIHVTSVNDVPVVNAGEDQAANEGQIVQFLGSYIDPGRKSISAVAVAWDFGDGITTTGTLTPSHVYADDGVYTATLTVDDGLGGVASDALLVTVDNVAPQLAPIADQSLFVGEVLALTADFTDPGLLDTHRVLIDWGDGVTDTLDLAAGLVSFDLSHAFDAAGVYTVSVTLTDDDGGTDVITFQITAVRSGFTVWLPFVGKDQGGAR